MKVLFCEDTIVEENEEPKGLCGQPVVRDVTGSGCFSQQAGKWCISEISWRALMQEGHWEVQVCFTPRETQTGFLFVL